MSAKLVDQVWFLLKKQVSVADAQNNDNWFNFFQNSFVTVVPGVDAENNRS